MSARFAAGVGHRAGGGKAVPSARITVVLAALGLLAPMSALASVQEMERDSKICMKDPRYNVGGAAIGDCLMELSEGVDKQIKVAFDAGLKRFHLPDDIEAYWAIQAAWLDYRKRMCGLVRLSPDNTASWVNSAACYLELGREQLDAMRYTNEYGSARTAE